MALSENSTYQGRNSVENFMERLLERNNLGGMKNHATPMFKLAEWLEKHNVFAVNEEQEIVFLKNNIVIPNSKKELLKIIASPVPICKTGVVYVTVDIRERLENFNREFNDLSPPERRLLLWIPPYILLRFNQNATIARQETAARYDVRSRWGGEGDAFRHALWLALNTQVGGEDFARRWGDAYEHRADISSFLQADTFMDIHNNEVGIEIGRDNRRMNLAGIISLIRTQIRLGKLLVMKRKSEGEEIFYNELYWTNDINFENTVLFDDVRIKRREAAQRIVDAINNDTVHRYSETDIININEVI